MLSSSDRIKLLLSGILLIAVFYLGAQVQGFYHQTAPFSPQEESSRGFDTSEENIPWMQVDKEEVLVNEYGDATPTLINQIYSRHYELFGEIVREGQLKSNPTFATGSKSFKMYFPESNRTLLVTTKEINLTARDFDVTVSEVK